MGGGDRVRAVSMMHEGMEVARAVRDGSFASLTTGQHGYYINASQQWAFTGALVTRTGSYTVSLDISSAGTNWAQVTSLVKWKHGYNRSGSILITGDLTNWRTNTGPGNWSTVALDGSYTAVGSVSYNSAAVSGNYAYVTSETSGGGAGLYVFDISNTASPARVASSFSLGSAGYGVAIKGRTLYVLTNDASSEIQVYDITSPTTLSVGNLITSYNLSGSSLGLSLALRGPTLFVGAQQDATFKELYAFDVRNTGAILPMGNLEISANVNGIALTGTSAFLATSDTAAEMKVVYAQTGTALSFPTNHDYNVTSTEVGRSVFATGTAAILGRQKGSIQEMMLALTTSVPMSAPGPWYHEGSGSLVGISADPAGCYAFLAADSSKKAFQVANLRDTSLPELTTYDSTNGPARGIFYDIVRDRAFVLTRGAVLILRPGSSTSACS